MRWSIDSIALFVSLVTAAVATGQNMEMALANWVESGILSPTEAEALELHVLNHGFPIAVEEAAAVVGLSSLAVEKLVCDPEWRRWVDTSIRSSRDKLRLQWNASAWLGVSDSSSALGPPTSLSLRAERSRHWGLRCDRGMGENGLDHLGGFVALPVKSRIRWLLGDHSVRWGLGLVCWSSSAYDGLRSATAVQLVPHAVRPVIAGDAMKVRRGIAIDGPWLGGQIIGSVDASAVECRMQNSEVLTWYRDGQHRTEFERNRGSVRPVRFACHWHRGQSVKGWGSAFELGRIQLAKQVEWNGIAGVHGHCTAGRSRWAGELAASPGSISWAISAIWTWSKSWDAFCRWQRFPASHPAEDWGEVWKVGGASWVWGVASEGQALAQHAQWNWDGEQLDWFWQVKAELLKDVHGTLRLQGSPHSQDGDRIRGEVSWEAVAWKARAWIEWQRPGSFAGGMSWSFQSRVHGPKWKWGWSESTLNPGQNVYVLEPHASAWQTTVLSGRTDRIWAVVQWKWGRSFTASCSASNSYRSDTWAWPDAGPWVWKGNSRWEFRMRLAYAL